MSESPFSSIRWPEIPMELQPALAKYLREMQQAIDRHLRGNVIIPGDVAISGNLLVKGTITEETPVP